MGWHHNSRNSTPTDDDLDLGLFSGGNYRAPEQWIANYKGGLGGDFVGDSDNGE